MKTKYINPQTCVTMFAAGQQLLLGSGGTGSGESSTSGNVNNEQKEALTGA